MLRYSGDVEPWRLPLVLQKSRTEVPVNAEGRPAFDLMANGQSLNGAGKPMDQPPLLAAPFLWHSGADHVPTSVISKRGHSPLGILLSPELEGERVTVPGPD